MTMKKNKTMLVHFRQKVMYIKLRWHAYCFKRFSFCSHEMQPLFSFSFSVVYIKVIKIAVIGFQCHCKIHAMEWRMQTIMNEKS